MFSFIGEELEQQQSQIDRLNLPTMVHEPSSLPTRLNRTVATILLRQRRVRHDKSIDSDIHKPFFPKVLVFHDLGGKNVIYGDLLYHHVFNVFNLNDNCSNVDDVSHCIITPNTFSGAVTFLYTFFGKNM